jgi:MFS transporter, ACS family, hexuronate transporter
MKNTRVFPTASIPSTGEIESGHGSMKIGYSASRKLFILASLLFSWILANADRIAMTISIIPISKEFGLDSKSAGYVLSAFYVSYALVQLVAGWLSDRFGSKGVLIGCVATWSIFTGLTGMASSLAVLLVIRFLFGLGEGGFSPASTVTIAEVFPKKERARAKSLVIGAIFIGGAAGTGSIAALINAHGWRFAYHVLGLIGLVMALILWYAIKDVRPRSAAKPGEKSAPKFRTLARMSIMRKTTMIFFFSNIVLIGLMSWMPTFLVKTKNIDIIHVGVASAIPYVVAFISLNVVGWLLDKVGHGRERLFMAVGGFCIVLFLGLMTMSDSLTVLLTFWTLSMVGYTMVYGTIYAIPLKHLPDEMVGTAAGVINFGGQCAAAVAPATIGLLVGHSHGSFTSAFLFLLCSGVGVFLVALTWRVERSDR